ncbi:tryptophan synthase subunit alpha [Sphingomonas sp. RB56-2]|uniref:Tryptophan synthase alpha chain n=1 Tax=Sphingomonas brevis TaxID=2908206 RepID=A0ABT0SAP2_9SPHN|nr:tryptophan synthase subunit alpha [Sphingomonas brevis]MCL6741232.1 tryptophan synthase subunit alpha [Sphingomonas brevis]
MSRYASMFERLAAQGDAAFGAFLVLGDPDLATSAALLDAAVEGGADMIEVGIPFSDPVADGPVIQAAAQRALAAGARVADCLGLIADFRIRHQDVPVGILTYANLVMPGRGFMHEAAKAGADSLLIADVPAIEAEPFARRAEQAGLEPVLIAAANTPEAALRRIAAMSKAYTYCVSRAGITGTHSVGEFDAELILRLKAADAPPPIFGFGISEPAHVRAALKAGAAGVICGSAIVSAAAQSDYSPARVSSLVSELKGATTRCAE